jgi:hypothetical protein
MMKKIVYFTFSLLIAFSIAGYNKYKYHNLINRTPNKDWNTFIKKNGKKIETHETTKEEYAKAKIQPPEKKSTIERNIASQNQPTFLKRGNRKIIGDKNIQYTDLDYDIEYINDPVSNWKELLGHELTKFQKDGTIVLVKEDEPTIQIENGKGRFLEEVTITYILIDGKKNSFKAYVDSETGTLIETWDRTINEQYRPKKEMTFDFPAVNESGIITR